MQTKKTEPQCKIGEQEEMEINYCQKCSNKLSTYNYVENIIYCKILWYLRLRNCKRKIFLICFQKLVINIFALHFDILNAILFEIHVLIKSKV